MRYLKKVAVVILICCSGWVNAQVVKMPFSIIKNSIHIKTTIGKSDSLMFIFDTGATATIVDSVAAEKAGVSKINSQKIEVAEYGGVREHTLVGNQTLNLPGKLEIKDVELLLMNLSGSKITAGDGYQGIIGYDILNRYTTKFDFDRNEISLYNNIAAADTTGYTGITFEFSKGIMIPRFPISITTLGGETFTGKVMFDSGAASTLFISASFKKFHQLGVKMGKTVAVKGRGVHIETNDEKAVIQSMNFNGFNFGKMVIGMAVDENATPKDGYLGLIGLEIIKHFNVIVDYANKKIYLKPNKAYKQPFNDQL